MKRIVFILSVVAFRECIASEKLIKQTLFKQLHDTIDQLHLFPTALVRIVSEYARVQKWIFQKKLVTSFADVYIMQPWLLSNLSKYAIIGMQYKNDNTKEIFIKVFNLDKAAPKETRLTIGYHGINSPSIHASFSSDDTLLAVTIPRQWTYLYTTKFWTLINTIDHRSLQALFLPNSTNLVIGHEQIQTLSASGDILRTIEIEQKPKNEIDALSVSPDGSQLIVAVHPQIIFFHLNGFKKVKTITIPEHRCTDFWLSPDNTLLLYKAFCGTINLYNINEPVEKLVSVPAAGWVDASHWAQITSHNELAFIKSSKTINIVKINRKVQLKKDTIASLKLHNKANLRYFSMSVCGTQLFALSTNGIYIWRLEGI